MRDDLTSDNLQRLSEGDFQIADGEPDPRGWTVRSSDGRDLGEIDDLIVDPTAMKVRYFEVDPSGDWASAGDDSKVFIPAADVDIRTNEEQIIVRDADVSRMRTAAPVALRDRGMRSGEETIATPAHANRSDSSQRLTRAEEEVRVGTRPVQAGEVRVGKHVETERVEQEVPVMRERVHIERRPVTDANAPAEIRASEHEIRVPITEEEVVVEKRAVVKEELVVSKEQVQETEHVSTDVRREEFDVQDTSRGARPATQDRGISDRRRE